jgi:hypothetical protein
MKGIGGIKIHGDHGEIDIEIKALVDQGHLVESCPGLAFGAGKIWLEIIIGSWNRDGVFEVDVLRRAS